MDQRARRRRPRKRQRTGLKKLLQELGLTFGSPTYFSQLLCDQLTVFVLPLSGFFKDSVRLLKRCTKPDRQEFQRAVLATAVGFLIMGFLGFVIKLLHIPITNIIVD